MVGCLVSVDKSQNPEHLKWAEQRTGWKLPPADKVWFTALDDNENVLGLTFFHTWFPGGNVCLGFVLDETKQAFCKKLMRETFNYGFNVLYCARLTVFVSKDLLKEAPTWIEQLEKMGAVQEAELVNWFGPSMDAILMRFTVKDMLNTKVGQKALGV